MSRIKKLFRICEHRFTYNGISQVSHREECNQYDAMPFRTRIACSNCSKIVIEDSKVFLRVDIASDYDCLRKPHYWSTADGCLNQLETTTNANLARRAFYIKLNKKYNLNLRIED